MPLWGYAVIVVFVLMLIWPSTVGRLTTWMRRRRRHAKARRRARQDARQLRGHPPSRPS